MSDNIQAEAALSEQAYEQLEDRALSMFKTAAEEWLCEDNPALYQRLLRLQGDDSQELTLLFADRASESDWPDVSPAECDFASMVQFDFVFVPSGAAPEEGECVLQLLLSRDAEDDSAYVHWFPHMAV